MIKPALRAYKKPERLSEYPKATCFEAGHLVTKNAGWRNKMPVIEQERCIGCGQCYLYCPDGVIAIQEKKAVIDYDFCKGCGICAKICKLHVIRMEDEPNG